MEACSFTHELDSLTRDFVIFFKFSADLSGSSHFFIFAAVVIVIALRKGGGLSTWTLIEDDTSHCDGAIDFLVSVTCHREL